MRVTITGADDRVAVNNLEEISKEFSFVEWGILFSSKNFGRKRYPSLDWIDCLFGRAYCMNLSLHLCGKDARHAMSGRTNHIPSMFGRIQINGYMVGNCGSMHTLSYFSTLIFQCRNEETLPLVAREAKLLGGDVLFDPSGGRGIKTVSWPDTPIGCHLGFAGGIDPDNVLSVLEAIGPREEHAWIDMESGVRTDNEFDINKVVSVLEKVKKFNINI